MPDTFLEAKSGPNRSLAQWFPNPFTSRPCEIYTCRNRAKWVLGRPDGTLVVCHYICEEHAREVLSNLPEELRDFVAATVAAPLPVKEPRVEPEATSELAVATEPASVPEPEVQRKDFSRECCGQTFTSLVEYMNHRRVAHGKKEAVASGT